MGSYQSHWIIFILQNLICANQFIFLHFRDLEEYLLLNLSLFPLIITYWPKIITGNHDLLLNPKCARRQKIKVLRLRLVLKQHLALLHLP